MAAKLELEIPEGQINNAIAVALAESFGGEKRDALIRDIIRAHLAHKENSYDKETLLSKRVGQLIRNMTQESFEAEVEKWRPEVDAVVREHLGSQFKTNVFEALRNALTGVVIRNLVLSGEFNADDD